MWGLGFMIGFKFRLSTRGLGFRIGFKFSRVWGA